MAQFKVYVKHFTVPSEAYRRYRYTKQHVPPLLERFQDTVETCHLKDTFPNLELADVHIYSVSYEGTDIVTKAQLTGLGCLEIKCESFTCKTTDEFQAKTKDQVFVCVAGYREAENHSSIWSYLSPAVLLIADEYEIKIPDMKFPDENNIVCIRTKQNIASDLDLILERIVFKHLLPRVRLLRAFTQSDSSVLTFAGFNERVQQQLATKLKKMSRRDVCLQVHSDECRLYKEWHEARLDTVKSLIVKTFGKDCKDITDQIIRKSWKSETGIEVRPLTVAEHVLPYLGSSDPDVSKRVPDELLMKMKDMQYATDKQLEADMIAVHFKRVLDRIVDNQEDIEQLYRECIAMYRRSKVPQFEKPATEPPAKLERKVAEEILQVQGVTGCGYRFSTLDVYFKDTLEAKERQNAEKDVLAIIMGKVERHAFLTEGNVVRLNSHCVGKRILGENGMSASLGGFAERGNEKKLSLLLARHFAENSNDIYVETSHGRKCIATVIHPKQQHEDDSMDILAADVLNSAKCSCKTNFKDSLGVHSNSRLEHFVDDDLSFLEGLPVHIWGAASSPGLGVIIIPTYYVEGMKQLVKIQDRHPVRSITATACAREGDSGAVVCADDPSGEFVHVISMLMGMTDVKVTYSVKKQQYLTFRLKDGLSQLESQTGEHFEIC